MELADKRYISTAQGFSTKDRLAGKVSKFCKKNHIPYSTPFVSVEAFDTEVTPLGRAGMYGGFTQPVTVFLRIEQVLDDIHVVSLDDFQDVTANAYDKQMLGQRINSYLGQIVRLPADQASKLRELTSCVARRSGKYVEARLHRALRATDVDCFVDDHTHTVIPP
jgi:hypothetical protein